MLSHRQGLTASAFEPLRIVSRHWFNWFLPLLPDRWCEMFQLRECRLETVSPPHCSCHECTAAQLRFSRFGLVQIEAYRLRLFEVKVRCSQEQAMHLQCIYFRPQASRSCCRDGTMQITQTFKRIQSTFNVNTPFVLSVLDWKSIQILRQSQVPVLPSDLCWKSQRWSWLKL